jgi:hypothetical protein
MYHKNHWIDRPFVNLCKNHWTGPLYSRNSYSSAQIIYCKPRDGTFNIQAPREAMFRSYSTFKPLGKLYLGLSLSLLPLSVRYSILSHRIFMALWAYNSIWRHPFPACGSTPLHMPSFLRPKYVEPVLGASYTYERLPRCERSFSRSCPRPNLLS